MSKIPTLQINLGKAPERGPRGVQWNERLTGHQIHKQRRRRWLADPYCAECGRLTIWPDGFELDHIVPVAAGGSLSDHNTQVLCMWRDIDGSKHGCHSDKTAREAEGIRRGCLKN